MQKLSIEDFAEKVSELMPVIMKEYMRRMAGDFYKMKITMPQFFVIELLHRNGETKMSDIAGFLNVSTAAMTGIVERLVRDAYVVRVSDPADRRIVMIRLTPKGAATVKDILAKRNETTIKVFGMISQKEREDYLSILTHIQEHLKE